MQEELVTPFPGRFKRLSNIRNASCFLVKESDKWKLFLSRIEEAK